MIFHSNAMQNSHRHIQLALKKALAPEEVWLERSFPQIGRIADCVWPGQKLIFEIQCSRVSPKEILARNRDYQKMGYSVIWILHDRHYNRPSLTLEERLLLPQTHYFTNINSLGSGEIYDQYSQIRWGKRVMRGPRYPIALSSVTLLKQIPRHLPKERRNWLFSFGNDFFHHPYQPIKRPFFPMYRLLFQSLLEKVTD